MPEEIDKFFKNSAAYMISAIDEFEADYDPTMEKEERERKIIDATINRGEFYEKPSRSRHRRKHCPRRGGDQEWGAW
ncbi:MAG: hypothetical protein PHI97_33755 [Desulfobulbus sp.]|nr:hypothetical protein [Desulfobulbus sp.]